MEPERPFWKMVPLWRVEHQNSATGGAELSTKRTDQNLAENVMIFSEAVRTAEFWFHFFSQYLDMLCCACRNSTVLVSTGILESPGIIGSGTSVLDSCRFFQGAIRVNFPANQQATAGFIP